ncbi:MAG: hypothetical protein KatS3mg104_2929 [Phycisphaerae bacterium]|nr:MAG: hypothetical protein KatS3mg104_2929 [Phycisphaerae bacterium]
MKPKKGKTPFHIKRLIVSDEIMHRQIFALVKKVYKKDPAKASAKDDARSDIDFTFDGYGVSVKVRDVKFFEKYGDILITERYLRSGLPGELIAGEADFYMYAIVDRFEEDGNLLKVFMIPMNAMRALPGETVTLWKKGMRMKAIDSSKCEEYVIYDATKNGE